MSESILDDSESILDDTKQVLGIHAEATEFDTDVVMAINSAIFQLMQLGVGPATGFRVVDKNQTWTDLLGSRTDLEAAKSYIFITARLLFDRPETSYGIQALEDMRAEYGWRLEYQRRVVQNG